MYHSSPMYLNRSRAESSSKLFQDSLLAKETTRQQKQHLLWGSVNVTIVSILAYHLLHKTTENSIKDYVMQKVLLTITVILIINSCFHFIQYVMKSFVLKTYTTTPNEKKNHRLNKTASPENANKTQQVFTATSPMNLTTTHWLFSASAVNENPNTSVGRNSFNESWNGAETFETSPVSSGSFWKNSSSAAADVSPILRRCVYQLAPISPVNVASTSPTTTLLEESHSGGSPVASMSHSEFWRRVKIDQTCLTQWNANLRMWISLTILEPLVAELDHINAAFVRYGLSDLHIGSVGLDRLKRTASIPQVIDSIPSLPRLVLFLEMSQHQEYLVTRIRDLAKGGSMSEFRWNNGGPLHGKAWEEHLPTDAALVIHLIATYLDLQLVPAAQRTDGQLARPFSTQHLVRSPERPPARPHAPIIHQTHLNPPNYVLVVKDETFDVPKGRNNMLHTFLLFIHLLKTTEYGMLGPLNLGRSGVNILWVVES